jgi:hypothetical protein
MLSFDSIATSPILITPPPPFVNSPPTDRDTLEQRLAQAEGYMAMSRERIARRQAFER